MRMKKEHLIILISFLTLPLSTFGCWELDGKPQVSWMAFKTPLKVGVGGRFKSLQHTGKSKAKNLEDLLKEQSITINPETLSTKNPARDQNILKSFFNKMKSPMIKASIVEVKKNTLNISIVLNNKKKKTPMSYQFEKGMLKARGHIDLLDFQLEGPLKSINEACLALHEGKTWSHVEIFFEQKLKKCTNL